jgi:hypothetical protein
MIRLFDERLRKCALRARIRRRDKPNFVTAREQILNRRRFQVSSVLRK